MKKVTVTLFLILLATVTTFAQGVKPERNWSQNVKEESIYPLSTIVQCYATTNSLSAFVQCLLGNSEQPPRRHRHDLENLPFKDFRDSFDRIERRDVPEENKK